MKSHTTQTASPAAMRSLLKQLYRYTHSRALRHNEDLWPWMRASRDTTGRLAQLKYRRQTIELVPATMQRNTARGAVYLLTTGPSINALSAPALRHRDLMGVNGAFHLSSSLRFQRYAVIDRGFASLNRAALCHLLENGTHLFTTPFCLYALLQGKGIPAQSKITIIEQFTERLYRPIFADSHYVQHMRHYPEITVFRETPLTGFSRDISLGIFDARTVAYAALQIAAYLGFSNIHFIGLDMKTSSANQNRFYEHRDTDSPRSSLNLNFQTHILPAFTAAANLLRRQGITLVNHSMNSALPDSVIPKAPYTPAR